MRAHDRAEIDAAGATGARLLPGCIGERTQAESAASRLLAASALTRECDLDLGSSAGR